MAKRVGGVSAFDGEHGVARGAGVVNDDLGLPGEAVPPQGDRETVTLACVEFNEHGIDLSGLGVEPVGAKAVRDCGTGLVLRLSRGAMPTDITR
jgi:hypothetical protein